LCFFRKHCGLLLVLSTEQSGLPQHKNPNLPSLLLYSFDIFVRPWGKENIFRVYLFSVCLSLHSHNPPPLPFDTLSTQADRPKNRYQRHDIPPCGPRESRERERVDKAPFRERVGEDGSGEKAGKHFWFGRRKMSKAELRKFRHHV
jgi:hypothetical protein